MHFLKITKNQYKMNIQLVSYCFKKSTVIATEDKVDNLFS